MNPGKPFIPTLTLAIFVVGIRMRSDLTRDAFLRHRKSRSQNQVPTIFRGHVICPGSPPPDVSGSQSIRNDTLLILQSQISRITSTSTLLNSTLFPEMLLTFR